MNFRVGVFGSSGRMGQEILRLCNEQSINVAGKVDRNDPDATPSIDKLAGDSIDVLIDFSLPETFAPNLNWCVENKVPYVCGTTNLSESDFESLNNASKVIPCLWAPNMSLGVNLVAKMMEHLKAVADFDFQIVESHHTKKIDSPSGTAKFLQNVLVDSVGKAVPEPLALRGGGIFGVHEVHIMGEEETIKLEHVALNRAVFARGAISAAKWLMGKTPGRYTMSDLVG